MLPLHIFMNFQEIPMIKSLFLGTFCLLAVLVFAQSIIGQVDANTLLLLRFENSLNGELGDVPTGNFSDAKAAFIAP